VVLSGEPAFLIPGALLGTIILVYVGINRWLTNKQLERHNGDTKGVLADGDDPYPAVPRSATTTGRPATRLRRTTRSTRATSRSGTGPRGRPPSSRRESPVGLPPVIAHDGGAISDRIG
jgi:hypothetical protein